MCVCVCVCVCKDCVRLKQFLYIFLYIKIVFYVCI